MSRDDDDDADDDHDYEVFYSFLQKQKMGAELHIYIEEGAYHKRLFRGPSKVYMELGSYFLFLQEQIKDIIII